MVQSTRSNIFERWPRQLFACRTERIPWSVQHVEDELGSRDKSGDRYGWRAAAIRRWHLEGRRGFIARGITRGIGPAYQCRVSGHSFLGFAIRALPTPRGFLPLSTRLIGR